MKSLFPKRIDSSYQPAVTAGEMTRVDEIAIQEFGINMLQMMELAGYQLAQLSTNYLDSNSKVLVLIGTGHNGGGGLVTVKHLYNWGFSPSVYLLSPDIKPLSVHQLDILSKTSINILREEPSFAEFDLIIDAILGYNIQGDVDETVKEIINAVNSSGGKILSLDIPSGLNPNTGSPMGVSIKADATLTLAAPKTGLLKKEAAIFVGDLFLADIGIPPEVFTKL